MSIIARIDYSHTSVTGTQTNGQVFISLFDAATNQPVNGNNIVIYFTQNINGSVTNGSATIPGQSSAIYTGLLNDTSNGYHTAFYITGQSSVPPPAAPVNICDLAIENIIVDSPETSPGANNASITVNATSSYGPIQYSLDNSTWQTSNIFTGLNGGLKTIYVKDTNPASCLVSSNITIPILTNLLVSDPSVTIGGNVSRWNAVFNPIPFIYQRKDFEVTAASSYSGGTTFTINGDMTVLVNMAAANVIAGANATPFYVYINAGPYNGVYQVITATLNTVTVIVPYTATAAGFLNSDNILPYYKIITQIQYTDPVTGQSYIVNSNNRPDATGLVRADISNFLQSLLKAVDKSDYSAINYRDDNLSASYRIAYAESWDDGTNTGHVSAYIQLSNTYYATYTARQLGQKYGGNMMEFVPFTTKQAKWVTDFTMPAYSLTFPFDLGFIYSEVMAGYELYYKVTLLDINKNNLLNQSVGNAYLLNEDGSFLLNTDGSKLIISENNLVNTPIVEQVGLNRLLLDYNLPDECYYFTVGIYYHSTDTNSEVQVIQDQIVRVDKDCDYNSVYLRWIGLTGSWNYYRFTYNQEVTLDVQNATIIEKYVTDWENQETIEDVVKKSAGQKMQVHAEDMSVDDIKGVQSIKYSPKVQMLVSKGPIKWQTVILNTATFAEFETNLGTYQFAVTFNLPGINVQSQ